MITTSPVIRRSAGLSATAAAAGVTAALVLAAAGASLNIDLVVNGGFETVTSPSGAFATVSGGWTNGTFGAPAGGSVFAYNYAANYDNRSAGVVPAGNVATSNIDYYWTMNGADLTSFQTISLAAGATGAAILAGTASYDIRGFFTGYLNDLEQGRLSLQFTTAANALIGAPIAFNAGNDFWNQVGGTGAIPTNAANAVITLGRDTNFGLSSGPDVYVDNVSFVVVPEPSSLLLSIAGTGLVALRRKRR